MSGEAPAEGLDDFQPVFLEYHPRFFRYFRSLGFSAEDADDLCQTALLNVYRGRGSVRDGTVFESWIFTVARNAARDAWRRRGDARSTEPADETLPAPAPSPERVAADRERLDLVRQGLAALPARMRACFLLRVQDDLSYDEIGGRLALSPGTVKVQVWNARRRLREVLR